MRTNHLTIGEIVERIRELEELQREQYNPYRERNIIILKTALKWKKQGKLLVKS